MIWKSKKKFQRYKSPIFLEDVIFIKLFSNKISSGEKKNYKFFIGYFCVDYKFNLLHITLPKTSTYVKSYDGQT